MFLETFIGVGLFGSAGTIALSKVIKTKIPEEMAEQMEAEGLYHMTSEESAQKIMESGYLKPSGYIMSYGKKACFMFNGIPDVSNYVKNMDVIDDVMNAESFLLHAIKLNPPKEDIQNHYLMRPLNDGAIMYEGRCVFNDKQAQYVQLTLDAKQLEDGKTQLYFRERTPEEIEQNPKGLLDDRTKNMLQEYAKQQSKYKNNFINKAVSVAKSVVSEFAYMGNGIKQVWNENIGNKKHASIEETTKQKCERLMNNGILAKNTPVHTKAYADNKLMLQNKGLKPLYINQVFDGIRKPENQQLIKKFEKLSSEDKYRATLALAIAQNGNFEGIQNEKNLNILISSLNKDVKPSINPSENKMIEILAKSKNAADLDSKLKGFDEDERNLMQSMFAIRQDTIKLSQMTSKKNRIRFEPQSLNLDGSKTLIDCAYQLREFSTYMPNFESVLETENKATAKSFVEKLNDEVRKEHENDVNKGNNRSRMIEKVKQQMKSKEGQER